MGKKIKPKIRYKAPSSGLTAMAAPNPISSVRSSIGLDDGTTELFQIKVEQLVPYRNQARKVFDQEEIDALAQTIKEHGIRHPLTVIKHSSDEKKYEVISGERRLRAAIQVGLTKVPCVILQDASKANEVALIENIQRTDLHPIEMAEAFQSLLDAGLGLTQQAIADKMSIKKSIVSETLKLQALPEEIKSHILTQNIKSRDLFRRLLALESFEEMKVLLKINQTAVKAVSMKSASILRITLSEGKYKIQKKAMSVLNSEQKIVLREKLQEIIEGLF